MKNLNWLKNFPALSSGLSMGVSPSDIARAELDAAFPDRVFSVTLAASLGDAFVIDRIDNMTVLTGGETGLLYGAYELIRRALASDPLPEHLESSPRYPLRMINCWDNMDGSVERGYAGRSLFFEENHFSYDPVRISHVARMLASVGLNVLCINNVNVHEPAQGLIAEDLPRLSALADLFRPFGVRLMISVDFSMPMRDGLSTADPLETSVQNWWRNTVAQIYREIPDLAGLLIKADSEGRPGPFTYGRSHADGANLLARALKPFGGVLVWRCFVYNCRQDWRDTRTDRPMAAFETYQPLDGLFDENVILQIKNGPVDFQVREPISPLLLSLNHTALGLELQLAQEYTGQQIDLYTMAPMWEELFQDLPADRLSAIAAVSNLGRDENYFGHPLAAANLFAFGMLAWDPSRSAEKVTETWIRLTYDFTEEQCQTLKSWMLRSRNIYEKYTAPLGIGWMVTPHSHYGPNPSGYEFDVWGTYHRANREAVGIDRTVSGTGYLLQYPPEFQSRYEDPESCPDSLKLFFHRLPYTFRMPDGRTLIQRIYDDHFEGAKEALEMVQAFRMLPFPSPDAQIIAERAERQVENANNWRDVINTFFFRLSGIPDQGGRKIYP